MRYKGLGWVLHKTFISLNNLIMKYKLATLLLMAAICCSCTNRKSGNEIKSNYYQEQFRPQFHFSPEKMWTNDPNGLVYLDGEYHLFYQYYPDSTVWGPMHWGHAVSTDLMHWKHLPIALYPDSLGYIFSGSAVIDTANSSGLGEPGKPAMVAIFTYHNPVMEKKGLINYQSQGMAYSLDKGRSWTKYKDNPVLPNPGLRDFRDPSVSWNSAAGKWIMTMAAGDHVRFYSSENLKSWKLESKFGKGIGAHGGVWECPSLFEMPVSNEPGMKKWVLLVSINPGGPNGGSATQYFTGTFNGHSFKNDDNTIRWIDYGPDDYAGILWSNTGDRKIFLGWMSNWAYANKVPTSPWRGAMTIPRELSLCNLKGEYLVKSFPVSELDSITHLVTASSVEKGLVIKLNNDRPGQFRLDLTLSSDIDAIGIEIANDTGQQTMFGYYRREGKIFTDRPFSGKTKFSKAFAPTTFSAPVRKLSGDVDLTILVDRSSAEFFFDRGLYTMTTLLFPDKEFSIIKIYTIPYSAIIRNLKVSSVESVWNPEEKQNMK